MKRDTILTIKLPGAAGRLEDYAVREPGAFKKPARPFTRRALAAAHVVADPFSTKEPWLDAAIDTAQRGMGLDWPNSLELIRRSVDAARDVAGAQVASGAGTDHGERAVESRADHRGLRTPRDPRHLPLARSNRSSWFT